MWEGGENTALLSVVADDDDEPVATHRPHDHDVEGGDLEGQAASRRRGARASRPTHHRGPSPLKAWVFGCAMLVFIVGGHQLNAVPTTAVSQPPVSGLMDAQPTSRALRQMNMRRGLQRLANHRTLATTPVADAANPSSDDDSSRVMEGGERTAEGEGGVLVAVCTAPGHFEAREAIRRTWGRWATQRTTRSPANHDQQATNSDQQHQRARGAGLGRGRGGGAGAGNTTVLFFVAAVEDPLVEARLQAEHALHRDLVRLPDFVDSYGALARKTLAMVVHSNEHGFSYLLKVDDDTFLHLPRFLDVLASHPRPRLTYAGVIHRHFPVLTNAASKWFMSDQFHRAEFPDYAAGPAYLLGPDLLAALYDKRELLFTYRVEDAGMGIWTENFEKEVVDTPAVLYAQHCSDNGDAVYVNPVTPGEMDTIWSFVQPGSLSLANVCGGGGGNFELSECQHNPCLCSPAPPECSQEGHDNWQRFMNEQYIDQSVGA